ncbi:hypothetical protein GCM10022199_23410 [Marihabitans asiaticum]|uniref:Competence protein ComEA n=1 Tax=Marihabitans asiaticum TaxID=415218 RepID=A0A560W9Y7_9MICO|nr:ComEA family DNA-binding protein [Marihabitans asiaticum]TWD14438.1 competence protein ComEA [Marihabitans asiaticum]
MRAPVEPSERLRQILAAAEAKGASAPDEPPPPRPVTVPAAVAESRWRLSPRAALGVGLVLLVAVLILGARTVLAERAAEPVPVAGDGVAEAGDRSGFGAEQPSPTGGSEEAEAAGPGSTGEGGEPAPASTSPAGDVHVHVVGEVSRAGVVTLPAGSRVADAVQAAGGSSAEADLSYVNLARLLVDGEQVVVPAEGEVPPVGAPAPATPGSAAGSAAGGSGGSAPTALVNINTADQAALEVLPGVGPVLAGRIVRWRVENGRFTSVDELSEVSGIGEKMLAQIGPQVTV